jgi:predicted small secreted protein
MKKNFLLVLTTLFLMTSILGCNTVKGAGQDISNAGGSIQRTAEHND